MTDNSKNDQWDLWEVFIQESDNAPHEHAGSIRAADGESALQNARDVFARRGNAKNMWVVKTEHIVSSTPADVPAFFDPTPDKAYRHPQFYKTTLE